MSSRGVANWLPAWIWASELRNVFIYPKGEMGVLENVRQSIVRPDTCLFIMVSYQGSFYLGRLNFDDQEFWRQIFELLKVIMAALLRKSAQ